MAVSLDLVRLGVGSAIFLYASWTDLQTRRVPNRTWLVGGGIGLALLAWDGWAFDRIRILHLVIIALIMASAYLLWYFHLLAGGADAKALMMLAVLLPVPLQLEWGNQVFPLYASPFPPVLVVLTNSLLVFLFVPFLFFFKNLAKGHVKFPAMWLGYKLPLEEARKKFVWIVERVDEEGNLRPLLFSSRFTQSEQEENVERLRALGIRMVWVTPKIPYMVPLLGAFWATFFFGDLLTHFLIEPLLS